jgi:hypothetical protein
MSPIMHKRYNTEKEEKRREQRSLEVARDNARHERGRENRNKAKSSIE